MYAQKDQNARLVPGLAAAIVLAIVAAFLGRLEPVIGGPVFGIVLGMLVATFRRGTGVLKPGAAYASDLQGTVPPRIRHDKERSGPGK